LAAGRFRRQGEEASTYQASAFIADAVDRLIIEYERKREAGDHPIKLATYLFHTLGSPN
jgi:hypothetical protein